ncbi:hypothetical protein Tco_0535654 [Tanacetum coccineum]
MYVSGHVNIFDMVDIDLFIVVALNMIVVQLGYTGESEPLFYNYLRPLTSLDEGLYALTCEEDVCFLATFVRYFKLIKVYIKHGVTALDSYIRPPRFRATIEEFTDEPGSISPIEHRSKKMLLLTWHDSSEPTKKPVFESVTPRSLPEHNSSTPCKDFICESITPRCMRHCMLTLHSDKSVITYTQLRCVQGVDTQDHETKLDGEEGFADVAGSGVESFSLSHDESFELPVLEEPDVGRTQEPIVAEVKTQEPIVEEVRTQEPTVEDFIVEDLMSRKGRYGVSKVFDTAYWGFLRVGTTFDIFQNILFPYGLNTAYWSFLDTAYWILFPSWSLVKCRHRYAVSSLMDMAYWLSEQ